MGRGGALDEMTSGHEPAGDTSAAAGGGHEVVGQATAGHGAAGHDEHGAEEELGPVDYGAWAAGILGVALGLLTAACFALATSPVGR